MAPESNSFATLFDEWEKFFAAYFIGGPIRLWHLILLLFFYFFLSNRFQFQTSRFKDTNNTINISLIYKKKKIKKKEKKISNRSFVIAVCVPTSAYFVFAFPLNWIKISLVEYN